MFNPQINDNELTSMWKSTDNIGTANKTESNQHALQPAFITKDDNTINRKAGNENKLLTPEGMINESFITQLLSKFKGHSLTDLNKANLMDRVDVKFMLPISFLPELLQELQNFYSTLEINNKRISRYYNQYFDTKNMTFYRDHHNGKLNRFKVRQRTYLDTDTRFLEVKFKNNQKRTIKTRVPGHDNLKNDETCQSFIHQEVGTSLDDLILSQQSGYQRIALANEESAERLTLDFNLWYQQAEGGEKINLPGFFIAELKQSKRSKLSPFYQLMSKHHIFPASFSKYCIGCALLYQTNGTLKTNKFKATLGQIEQFSLLN